jgi:hypothetical protein
MQKRLAEVARDPTFLAAAAQAERPIRYADPAKVAEDTRAAQDDLASFAELIRREIENARGVAPGR